MNSTKQKIEHRRPGKPDLSMLDPKTEAFINAGAEERETLMKTPVASTQIPVEPTPARIPKISVSLRVPQNITDAVMEMAANETLKTKTRVTPHDIYLRAITSFISSKS